MAQVEEEVSVVVVGGGMAGIRAASLLLPTFPDLLLVEASDRLGGRVQQVHGVAPWPVEAGPEFIHGAKSSLQALLKEVYNEDIKDCAWPDRWYLGREGRMLTADTPDPELEALHALMAGVGAEAAPGPGADRSAAAWLASRGASRRQLAAAEACYANDFGAGLDTLGLRELILENQRWDAGESYQVLGQSLSRLVRHLAAPLGDRVRLSWPVARVEWQGGPGGGVLLRQGSLDDNGHPREGAVLRCRRAVLTVPLAQLQRGRPAFSPLLPPRKAQALARLRMGNAIKVFLAFRSPFWPRDFFDVVCLDCAIPEFWATEHAPEGEGEGEGASRGSSARRSGECCLTGFAAGRYAEALGGLSRGRIVGVALQQLDAMFGCAEDRQPATSRFLRSGVVDWSEAAFVGGAYSYPSLGAEAGDREALAAPVEGALFFAGEATHEGVNPCLQAAYETGERAARQVLAEHAGGGRTAKL